MKIEFIDKEEYPEVYALLEKVRNFPENEETLEAKICLYWQYDVKPDQDGIVWHAKIQLRSETDRKLHGVDAVIYINFDSWQERQEETWREPLLFHEISHLRVSYDKDGEVKLNNDGTIKYRLRDHDIGEMFVVTARYGVWSDNHRSFLDTLGGIDE